MEKFEQENYEYEENLNRREFSISEYLASFPMVTFEELLAGTLEEFTSSRDPSKVLENNGRIEAEGLEWTLLEPIDQTDLGHF